MFALGVYRGTNQMAVFTLLPANMAVFLPGRTGGHKLHILRVGQGPAEKPDDF
jgi:hypothetical protein